MALKPTIYKFRIELSDLNREQYDSLNLTIAKHPSETLERMMARVLAFCLNSEEYLSFTKGLNAVEEADIWSRTLDDKISLWIDVGEPSFDRMKKSSRLAEQTKIYTFNSKADVWWKQGERKFQDLSVSIFQFDSADIEALVELVERTLDFSVTITGNSIYVAMEGGEQEIVWTTLQEK